MGKRGISLTVSVITHFTWSSFYSPFGATGIWTDNDYIFGAPILADPAQDARLSVQVIYGDVEKALDLRGMQIHGDYMVAASSLQHIRNELGRNRRSAFIFLQYFSMGR